MLDHSHKSSQKIPLIRAYCYILLSIALISGSCTFAFFYYKYLQQKWYQDPDYEIVAIVQSTSHVESLNTVYLAELLNLSVDEPTNFYRFNTKKAEQLLLQSPVIKEAVVDKIPPGTVDIEYSLRSPSVYLMDYVNAVMDQERVIFPLKPFFRPKNIPQVYLGIEAHESLNWGSKLKDQRVDLMFNVVDMVKKYCCSETVLLHSVDVSKAFLPSYGQRQMIVVLEERIVKQVDGHTVLCFYPYMLRLSPDNYDEQLSNYLMLRAHLKEQKENCPSKYLSDTWRAETMVIDLRLKDLAFISNSF